MNELSSKPVAEGRTAEVYLWDEQHILKLYRDWCPRDWVDYEALIARAVHAAGVPSPKAGEILESQNRRGLLYERLVGVSMLKDMNARPWRLFRHARTLADLHLQIHRQSIAGLPSYKDRLEHDLHNSFSLRETIKTKVLARLKHLPDRGGLCHGDYHPGNVFLAQDGPVVIDWITACSGSFWADVARTSMILSIGAKAAGQQVSPFIRVAIKAYHRTYLRRYLTLQPDPANEIAGWTPVIAAARLSENIVLEHEALVEMVENGLKE